MPCRADGTVACALAPPVYLLTRELLVLRLTPETKRELVRLAELRRAMIDTGAFN